MIVRPVESSDLNDLRKVWEEYYKNEFSFPNFERHFLATFLVTTDKGEVITAGGIKTILESVAITNKNLSTRMRREALFQLLQGSLYFADKAGYNELHAYVQGDNWTRILNNVGFQPTKGNSLVALW